MFCRKWGKRCEILKVKDCVGCKFYKTQKQYDKGLKDNPIQGIDIERKKPIHILRNRDTGDEMRFETKAALSIFMGKWRGWAGQKGTEKGHNFTYKNFDIELGG